MRSSEARRKFKLADELYRDKKYTEALTVLEKLDAEFPNAKNVMYPQAMCLAKLGRAKEAHEICQKLKAIYNDPRADKLMQKLAGVVPQARPPMFDPNAPGGGLAFNPLDLGDIGPVPGNEGADPMGLGELFAPKPGAAPPPQIDTAPNRKSLYIGLGVAGGILVLGLLCLPLFVGGSKSADTAQSTQPANAEPADDRPQIYWFNSYDTAKNASLDKVAPTLLFFYNAGSDDATKMMEETWKEPSIAHLVKGWTCVRIDTEADPDTTSYYEVTEVPTTIVEDDWKGSVFQQTGYVSAQDFYNAVQPLELKVIRSSRLQGRERRTMGGRSDSGSSAGRNRNVSHLIARPEASK